MSRDDELGELVAVLAQEADQVDREAHFPRRGIAALRERGLFGLMVPEEYGGLGGGLAEFTRTAAGLGSGCLSTALIWAMHCQQVDTVVRFGSERLRGEVLPRVARDGLYLASVTTERGKGGHLLSADSALTADGNEIVVDRDAPVVTGGAHADGYLLTARNAPGAAATETTLVYAHRSQVATEETGGWDTLGMRGTESVALRITGRVPDWQVVGPPGGFREVAVESMIPVGHLGWAACWLGAANGAFTGVMNAVRKRDPAIRVNLASDLARERIGRIRVDLELVGAYLDRARAEVESARATGRTLDRPPVQVTINSLKLAASELSFRAVDGLVQLTGLSVGYRKDSPIPLERIYRDLRSASLNYANDRLWTSVGEHSVLDRGAGLTR